MRDWKKKVISLLMAIVLCISGMPITSHGVVSEVDSGTCGENVNWSLTDTGILTISGEGEMTSAPWNSDLDKITSVVIEDGVTSIVEAAFYGCALTRVTIPASITYVGAQAFHECSNLTDVYAADFDAWCNIEFENYNASPMYCAENLYFDGQLFSGTLTLPSTMTEVGTAVFCGWDSLTGVTIPAGVTSVGHSAFRYCENLEYVELPDGMTKISNSAFAGCSNLSYIDLPDSLTTIGNGAFSDCTSLTEIIVPESVIAVNTYAFSGCSNLERAAFLGGISAIGGSVFENCVSLKEVFLPTSVTEYIFDAFTGCNALTDIYYGGTEEAWNALENNSEVDYVHYEVTYPANHWTTTTVPATCAEDGYTATACDCGYEKDRETLTATGHDYVDGVCSACGDGGTQPDPNPDASGTCGENVYWRLDGSTLTISGEGGMADYIYSGDVPWCEYREVIERVVIEDGVTHIGEGAFYNCSNLTGITIPDSISSIGGFVFSGCTSLTEFVIPEGVTEIGSAVFDFCSGLTSVTIPKSLVSIGGRVFDSCDSLTTIEVDPDNTVFCSDNGILFDKQKTTILQYPGGRTGSYTIPDGITSIGEDAFAHSAITAVTIPESVTNIGVAAFMGCPYLTEIVIPDSVVSIGIYAFNAFIDIYYGGTEEAWSVLEYTAEVGCVHYEVTDPANHWTITTVPATCTEDGYTDAVCECGYEKDRVYIYSVGHDFDDGTCSVCGYIPDESGTCGEGVSWRLYGNTLTISGEGAMTDFYHPARGELTAPWFEYTESIENVVIESGITSIGDYAFCFCHNLTSVTISNSVTSIGDLSFDSCIRLTEIILPNSITSIGDIAFGYCTSLTEITIPDSVTSIGNKAFDECCSLAVIEVDQGNEYYSSDNGVLFNKEKTELIQCPNGFDGGYTIPAGVTNIRESAFFGCSGLTDISIPDSVIGIGERAFASCYNLTSVAIPDSVISIENYAFSYCTSLISVTIPEDVTNIGDGAFIGCTSLTAIEVDHDNANYSSENGVLLNKEKTELIRCPGGFVGSYTVPDGVTNIKESAFYGCSGLTGISISNSVASIGDSAFNGCSSLTSIIIPDGVASIGNHTFYDCNNLTSVTIPDSVASIGDSAFCHCYNLTSVTIPESVTSIGYEAFCFCESLTSVTIPDSVTSIGDGAFYYCVNLISIVIPEGISSIGNWTFSGCYNLTDIYYGGTEGEWTVLASSAEAEADYIHYSVTDPANHWITTTVSATCTEDGYTDAVCACGYEKDRDYIYSIGHDYVDGVCSVCGDGANGTCGENVYWQLEGTILTISGEGEMADYSSSTYAPWYKYRNLVESIVIEEGVTSIGIFAFYGCSNLESIIIPDGVTSIGDYAFRGCSSLESITIPDGVTSIGRSVFEGCSSLESVTIPEGVTSIGSSAFNYCSSLESVTIPEGVTSIGSSAFDYCSSLKSITIPDGVAIISWSAFRGCSSLESITIPDGVTYIDFYAFENCSNLESITIPDSVTRINDNAFRGCSSLADIYYGGTEETWAELSNTPTADRVHYSVTDPTNHWITTTVPATCEEDGYTVISCPCGYEKNRETLTATGHDYVEGICSVCGDGDTQPDPSPDASGTCGENVYWRLDGSTLTIYGEGEMDDYSWPYSAPWYESGATLEYDFVETVVIKTGVTSIGSQAFFYCTGLTEITIPDSVTSIGESAFYECSSLTEISIPDSFTSIGDNVFSHCTGLTEITIPDSVTSIGSGAFSECSSLTSISIPDSITSIGSGAFSYCSSLSSITIPDSVTSIGDLPFRGCYSLTAIEVDPDNAYYSSDRGILFDKQKSELIQCPVKFDGGYSIPDSVTYIGPNAFAGCSGLTSISIPNGVTSIDNFVFDGCAGLTSVTILGNVTNIGERAFGACSNLSTITLPDSVTSIGARAFYGCSSLASINIPDSVTSIGDWAFANCTNLTNITIPDGVTSIGDYALYNCSGFTSITIPNSVTNMGVGAFSDCTGLTNIIIPDSVTSIDRFTFENCTSLTDVSIPDSVTSIGARAFQNCSNLTDIYYGGTAVHWAELENTPTVSRTHYSCTDADNHWITTTVPATCEEDGYTVTTCPCSYEKDRETFTATGHDYVDGVCSVCGNRDPNAEPDASGTCGTNVNWRLDGSTLTIYGEGAMTDFCHPAQNVLTAPWFEHKNNIENVVIESGVTSVGDYAFGFFFNLTSITIPEGVTSIGDSTFENCSSLTSITIPNSVISIGDCAFDGCTSLAAMEVGLDNAYYSSDNGVLFDRQKTELIECPEGFVGSYTIPDSVTSIDSRAFESCSGLTNISISGSVISIGERAFAGCTSLTSVTIPDSVTSVGNWAFNYCTSLISVAIPSSVISIGNNAFSGCTALTDIYYGGTAVHWAELENTPTASRTHYSVTDPANHWTITTAPATCTEDGYTVTSCPCSYEKDRETHTATGHDYVDGVCSNCGQNENGGEAPTVEIVGSANSGAVITAPEGGWQEGTNEFQVSCSIACVVVITRDGGLTYELLEAEATADANTYQFTAENMDGNTSISVCVQGDGNGDGRITNADVTRLRAAFQGKITLNGLEELVLDVNGSGSITNADYTRLKAVFQRKTTLNWR